ncbi:MAG: L-aspartate oxidase, partial [Terriglobales bacterium]
GREMGRALYAKARTLKSIQICEFEFSIDLCLEGGRVSGLALMDAQGRVHAVRAAAVLLASGGMGQVYRETTNPGVATGDGMAMAGRAGADLTDMEFVQFHPTALFLKNAPRFLLSEALRGEGAYLRNSELLRFMPKYHEMAELAPRDVVARAILHELEVSPAPEPVVYLDMTHMDGNHLKDRFPRIHSTCLKFNIDIATDLVPVRPAAHYAMGGVRTGLEGRTSVPGLYAAGEVSGTGVHGANRLASNSLLEGLVFGARAGAAMREEALPPSGGKPGKSRRSSARIPSQPSPAARTKRPGADEFIHSVQVLMWKKVGIVRDAGALRQAVAELEEWRDCLPAGETRRACEAANLHLTALLIARSALARRESRGAHYRTDFPQHDDANFAKHSVVRRDTVSFE